MAKKCKYGGGNCGGTWNASNGDCESPEHQKPMACQETKKKKTKLPTSSIQRSTSKAKKRLCRVCGCTDDKACGGGCYWVEPDLCSACDRLIPIVKMKMSKKILVRDRQAIFTLEVKGRKDWAEHAIEEFKIETGLIGRTNPVRSL